ncbi:MAG: hypothetical protein EHM48_01650 [Planctomycetaceae bacterium]|nr:MAG: hypothetical protein EHM48_01650 [Planctomycetaceae bacterium]
MSSMTPSKYLQKSLPFRRHPYRFMAPALRQYIKKPTQAKNIASSTRYFHIGRFAARSGIPSTTSTGKVIAGPLAAAGFAFSSSDFAAFFRFLLISLLLFIQNNNKSQFRQRQNNKSAERQANGRSAKISATISNGLPFGAASFAVSASVAVTNSRVHELTNSRTHSFISNTS